MPNGAKGARRRPKHGPVKNTESKPTVFKDDDDDDEHDARNGGFGSTLDAAKRRVGQQLQQQQHQSAQSLRGTEHALAAQQEDPSVFQFDEIDTPSHGGIMARWTARNSREKGSNSDERAPRYIESIKQQSKQRQRERSILEDRVMHKHAEREASADGSPPERFVTSAYKQKLQDDERWLQEDAAQESENLSTHIALGGGSLQAFYSSFLSGSNAPEGTAQTRVSATKAEADERAARSDNENLDREGGAPIDREHEKHDSTEEHAAAMRERREAPDVEPDGMQKQKQEQRQQYHQDHDAHQQKAKEEQDQNGGRKHSREEEIVAARERALARKRARQGDA